MTNSVKPILIYFCKDAYRARFYHLFKQDKNKAKTD